MLNNFNGFSVRNSIRIVYAVLKRIHRFVFHPIVNMGGDDHRPTSSQPSEEPPFDPTKPSTPISYPIKDLEDLRTRSYFRSFHFDFNRASVPLPAAAASAPKRPRILVCHDMAGGYSDDKWVQGGSNPGAYAIWHWHLIDVFVYFSHNLVVLPPPCWTNAAHTHGVKVLGTFITEWDEGRVTASKLLATKESAKMYAERLTELAVALGFDGWLLNMEVNLDVDQIPILEEFVRHLTQTMHTSLPESLVIWYDSVTKDGILSWQNQLNEYNMPFFDLCDGIFVNYSWEENYPRLSAAVAGPRRFDVYMGIDVFGRGTYGGGQWNTNVALDVLKEDAVSAAIFAPGWVYETKQKPDFETAQNRWWGLVEKSWGIQQHYPKVLPFYSNFDQGRGYHVSIGGLQLSANPWNNISSQSFQPVLDGAGGSKESNMQIFVNFNDVSYDGGVNITFKGSLEDNSSFSTRLFQGEVSLGDESLHISYSVKSNGASSLGVALEFVRMNRRTSLLIAGGQSLHHLSKQYDKVITPLQIAGSTAEGQKATGWTIHETGIHMNGYTLTEVLAVCYREGKPDNHQQRGSTSEGTFRAAKPLDFDASLGHIGIRTTTKYMKYPPASAWVVEGSYISWGSGSQGNKTVSLKIVWNLKPGMGDASLVMKYNIYIEKSQRVDHSENVIGSNEYMGVSRVQAFYVSNCRFSSNVSHLKFIIQVCGVDGSSQHLDDCPSFGFAVKD